MAVSNPAKGWHHVSVRDPKRFPIVATIQLGRKAEATDRSDFGIQARIGREKGKKNSGTKFVTLLFDPRLWTLARAKKWARDHGETVRETDEAHEKPGYGLSGRAMAIGRGRRDSDNRKSEVDFLKKHGVGCEVPYGVSAAVCKRVMAVSDDPAVVYSMTYGRFTDGERELLVVLPHDDVVRAVNAALRKALSDERAKDGHGARGNRSTVTEALQSLVDCMTGAAHKKLGAKRSSPKKTSKKIGKKRWHFAVSPNMEIGGRALVFPNDMLRYDSAEFASKKDKDRARDKRPGVHLVSDQEPTIDRWQSFGWAIVSMERK